MNDSFSNLGRWVSIFDRLMKMYYDRGLWEYEIGWGQQFYVEYLYDHPGGLSPGNGEGMYPCRQGHSDKNHEKINRNRLYPR